MNRILNKRINKNIIQIIGSYLLPDKKFLNLIDLNNNIEFIKNRLEDHLIRDNSRKYIIMKL